MRRLRQGGHVCAVSTSRLHTVRASGDVDGGQRGESESDRRGFSEHLPFSHVVVDGSKWRAASLLAPHPRRCAGSGPRG
jgi:hypothetical protein